MTPLTKETLREFIKTYPISFSPLTDKWIQQAHLEGIQEVLNDLEATFLWESTTPITNDGYLEEEGIIDKVIQTAKDNLAKINYVSKL